MDDETRTKIRALGMLKPPGTVTKPQKFYGGGAQLLQEVKGLYFRSQSIVLDGYKFIGCRFDNCQISINTTNFELDSCIIDPSTIVTFSNDLWRILRLYNRGASWLDKYPTHGPTRNADGTISILGSDV